MFHSAAQERRYSEPTLTTHACTRMQQRGIKKDEVEAALVYGRRIYAKGLTFFVIGEKEARRYAERGVDLAALVGLQVLVSHEGTVVTTYRSKDLHSIRVTPRPRSRQQQRRIH